MRVEHRTDAVVLDKVSLTLGSQMFQFDCAMTAVAITAIAGPSGSGKSTLLNLVAGFEKPDRGRILIAGADVSRLHPSDRPVSLVFQDNNLFGHLDLQTNVGLGINPALRLSPVDRDAVSDALVRVGLGGFERRMPGTLSGGERQRAAFARALVRRKPVLLLDEPFAALDPGLRADMVELLADLHHETGNSVLIVSHDAAEVERIASHLVFIDRGTVVLESSVAQMRSVQGLEALDRFLKA